MTATPEQVVQGQLEAYNRHDLEGFLAFYHEDAQIFRMPSATPVLEGRQAISAHYGAHRFCLPDLRVEILGRIVLGGKVIDHERVHGLAEHPTEVAAVYQVEDERIARVWFYDPA